ncbi:unnamed protein product, partial [Brenthis ino]
MKTKILIFIIFHNYIGKCFCYTKIGEPCNINTFVGTCKPIMKCPIAIKIVSQDIEHPPTCFWQEKTPIVCCPPTNVDVITGPRQIRGLFRSGRVRKTNDMICRYEDREPFLCCGISKYQVTPEPRGCPPLPSPKLNTPVEHPAWTKCVEYQRYFNICVAISDDNQHFKRRSTCLKVGKIAYGERARRDQFPHMAVIGCAADARSTDDIDISWIGGGSLISDKFILTAAHVILQTKAGVPRYALLGVLDKTKVQDGMLYNIINRIPHNNYSFLDDSKKHDIALVELHERVMFSKSIRPACLPVPEAAVYDKYIVAGWGQTETGKDSSILLHTHVTENEIKCKNIDIFDPEYTICAEGKFRKSSDSCQGDSGGPLMAMVSDLKCTYSVEGVVSYGPSCKGTGVYTRVNKYMDFIMKTVWPEEWEAYKREINRSNEVVSGKE